MHAGGFNHRAEALYKAHEESPQNANVKDAIQRGLRKVKILHWATPDNVFVKVVSLLNQFHQGAGVNHWDVMREALKLESAWKADCTLTRLNTYNPRYQAAYETFVINKSASSEYDGHFRSKLSYYNAISLAHNMQALDFFAEFQAWSNSHVDYLDPKYNAHTCIAQMHALTTMLMAAQRKYVEKPLLRAIVLEALKSCVRCSIVGPAGTSHALAAESCVTRIHAFPCI